MEAFCDVSPPRAKSHYMHLHGSKEFSQSIRSYIALFKQCLGMHGSVRRCVYDLSEVGDK